MVPITLDGRPGYGVVTTDGVGLRLRLSVDEFEASSLRVGAQVVVDAPGATGRFLLTTADEHPPFVFLRLLPLASRVAG